MKALRAAAAIALALALAACADEPVPTPSPDPAPANPEAVVNDAQLETILAEIGETLIEADAAADPDALTGRIAGTAVRLREAEYALAAITDGTVSPLTTESQVAIIAATDEWPRVVFVATSVPEGANLPLLLALVQEEPRAEYQLRSWVRILPGTALPQTVSPAVGSQIVPEDADDLLASPLDVLSQYVDLMNEESSESEESDEAEPTDADDEDSSSSELFAEDAFRELVAAQAEDLNEAVSQAGEASVESFVSTDDGVLALRTYDGGAIVFGVITSELRVTKTVPGGTLTVGEVLAYGGDAEITTEEPLTAHYLAAVAFYVPPAGSDEQISVLGAEHVLADVTREANEEESEG